jgi:hypothetical protein
VCCPEHPHLLLQVHNRDAVRQELWGLALEAPCSVGDDVMAVGGEGKRLGTVTSYVDTPDRRHRALAYLRCRAGGERVGLEGTVVEVAGVRGRVIDTAFATRAFPGEAAGGQKDAAAPPAAVQDEEDEAVAAARAAKLKAMQDRLTAWQQQQLTAEN